MVIKVQMVEARARLTRLPEELKSKSDMQTVAVTRNGEPVLAIMPWELYEGLIETMEILADRSLMEALKESLEDVKKGRMYSEKEVKKALRL